MFSRPDLDRSARNRIGDLQANAFQNQPYLDAGDQRVRSDEIQGCGSTMLVTTLGRDKTTMWQYRDRSRGVKKARLGNRCDVRVSSEKFFSYIIGDGQWNFSSQKSDAAVREHFSFEAFRFALVLLPYPRASIQASREGDSHG